MPVLMSKSAGVEVARALRKADGPGVIEVGVREGRLYVELVHLGQRTQLFRAAETLITDALPIDTLAP